jgi:hypothetical protein
MRLYSKLVLLFLALHCAVSLLAAGAKDKYFPLVIAPFAQNTADPFKNSLPTKEFVEQSKVPAGVKAPVRSVVYAAFDSKYIYFKYVMEQVDLHDTVELFISSGRNHHHYLQVYLSLRAPQNFSTIRSAIAEPEMKKFVRQRMEIKGSTRILYLTLDRAGFPELKEDDFIRVNFNRTVVSPKLSHTCWSNTINGFQQPDRFGWMILRSEKDFCEKYFAVKLQEELALIRKYDAYAPGHLDRSMMKDIERAQREFLKDPTLASGEKLTAQVVALREKFTETLIQNQFQPKK